MLPPAMPRLGLAILVVVAAGLIVVSALLPEYLAQPGDVGIRPLDPERPGWVASLLGILVQVGLLLVSALLLVLSDARAVGGGILIGAGVLGLSLRLVRIVQLMEAPGLDPAIGSWADLVAEGSVLAAGGLTLTWTGPGREPDDELLDADDELLDAEEPPPPGEAPPT